nr:hypothetical protein CFP56_11060 [Quercus suber]
MLKRGRGPVHGKLFSKVLISNPSDIALQPSAQETAFDLPLSTGCHCFADTGPIQFRLSRRGMMIRRSYLVMKTPLACNRGVVSYAAGQRLYRRKGSEWLSIENRDIRRDVHSSSPSLHSFPRCSEIVHPLSSSCGCRVSGNSMSIIK